MKYKIYNQDVRQWAKEYKGEKFHALFADTPYELSFMGKSWDSSGVAFDPETWRALAEHLYPGAFLFVYAGTMNDDLISYAMRQAGLEKFHTMRGWVFASGFPKSTRIDTQIQPKSEQKDLGEHPNARQTLGNINICQKNGDGRLREPTDPLAKAWSGHRYGKQALKPALETVLIFQKPYEGRPIDSITKNGAGALNIDAGRVGVGEQWWERGNAPQDEITKLMQTNKGRWPANFFLTHSISCVQLDTADWQCVEQCPVRKLGEQSGELLSGYRENRNNHNHQRGPYGGNAFFESSTDYTKNQCAYNDGCGTASRFFHNSSWQLEILEQIERADEVQYCAKAGRTERELGLRDGGIGALRDGGRLETMVMNNHPTVKPIELNHHLASLLLPPKEYAPRRLLVPFSGVASELISAILAGWDEVVGIESDTEHGYIKIAEARLAWWVDKFEKCGDYEKLKQWLPKYDEEKELAMKKQISLF